METSATDRKSNRVWSHASGSVVIVGAGRFARNYVQALAELGRNPGGQLDAIQTLILTRTRMAAATALIAEISRTWIPSQIKLAAAPVRDRGQLQHLLQECRPRLVCITARDPQLGDRVHATYALLALDYGPVLCEKPFTVARDAEASRSAVCQLAHHPLAGRFGLELPLAVVKAALLNDIHWGEVMRKAREIDFLWQMQWASKDLVSDLALHPWSLIPTDGRVQVERFRVGSARIEAWLRWPTLADSGTFGCGQMVLACGGAFRGMRMDDHVLQFQYAREKLQVLEHRASWEEATQSKSAARSARVVLEVDNPLRQHIAAALQAHPIVGYQQAIQSHLFAQSLCA